MNRICVQWPRFGPYHISRLEALHHLAIKHGAEVVGLETAGADRLYAWHPITAETSFRREQVFVNRVFEDIRPEEMHHGIISALDRISPDAVVINSYSFPDARACLVWCRKNRRVAVVATDTREDAARRIYWRERFKSLLVNQFDSALVAGTPHREYFCKLGFPQEAVFLGYDAVDNAFFSAKANDVRTARQKVAHLPGLADERPFFVTCGRYVHQKNLDVLIRAYDRYCRNVESPWRLVLVGDGPLRSDLQDLISELGTPDVTLTGFRQVDELPAYYGLASAYVHPARNDQWGLAVNEAMACGLPVLVSTATGCARDLVVKGRNGFTFPHDDVETLYFLLKRIASEATDREAMGAMSIEIIAAWSLENYAEQTWSAILTGSKRSDRRMDPRVRLALWILRRVSTSVTSFHTVEG